MLGVHFFEGSKRDIHILFYLIYSARDCPGPSYILWPETCVKEISYFEFKALKNSLRNALLEKKLAVPQTLCCVLNGTQAFTHKKDCQGVLYDGTYEGRRIVVCEKCKSMSFVKKFNWICGSFKIRRQSC